MKTAISIQKISFFASSVRKSMHRRSSQVYGIHGILHRKLRSYNTNVPCMCCAFLQCFKHISKICLKRIFYKYDLYKIYIFEIRFFPLFLFKFTFFKNEKNVYNVLKLCIFYKSIANKKTYYFYTIFILDFLLFFIGYGCSKYGLNTLNQDGC